MSHHSTQLEHKKELYKTRRTPDWNSCTVMQWRQLLFNTVPKSSRTIKTRARNKERPSESIPSWVSQIKLAEPLTEIIKRLCNGNGCCQNATADKFVFKLQLAEPLTQRIARLWNGNSCCQHAAATHHVKMLVYLSIYLSIYPSIYLSIYLSILRFQTPTRRTPDSKNCTVMQWRQLLSTCSSNTACEDASLSIYMSIYLSI